MGELPPEDSNFVVDTANKILHDSSPIDPIVLIEQVYQLWWRWADFELFVISPTFDIITPPIRHNPELIDGTDEYEFVYPILDYGFKFCTSKSEDLYTAGMSNCKLFYTIEKIVYLLIERLTQQGVGTDTEVRVAINGHELALRKCFEVIINLIYNVIVTNFDPGDWGDRYLDIIKGLAKSGYGHPPQAPRDIFRQRHTPGLRR